METWLLLEYCDQGNLESAARDGRFQGDFVRAMAPPAHAPRPGFLHSTSLTKGGCQPSPSAGGSLAECSCPSSRRATASNKRERSPLERHPVPMWRTWTAVKSSMAAARGDGLCPDSGPAEAPAAHARPQATIYLCLMDIASGMDYLHSLGVLHGDVKGANVLLRTNAPTPYDARGFVCKVRRGALAPRRLSPAMPRHPHTLLPPPTEALRG